MQSKIQIKSSALLQELKQQTAFFRSGVSISTGLFLVTLHLLVDMYYHGLLGNICQKIILIIVILLLQFPFKYISKIAEYSKITNFALAEFVNILTILYSVRLHDHNKFVWAQTSAVVSTFYQGFLFSNAVSSALFAIKQTGIWVIAELYFGKYVPEDVSAEIVGIIGLCVYYFVSCYCNSVKDQEMCEYKLQVDSTHQKIFDVVETISDTICVVNSKCEVLFSNSSAECLAKSETIMQYLLKCEYHRKYFEGKNVKNSIVEDIKEVFSLEPGQEVEFGVVSQDQIYTEWKGKIIEWDEQVSMILSGRNVTQLLDLEREYSESQYKSALLRTVSHELRTPINAVIAITQTIKESKNLTDENRENLDIIIGSCSFQLCLINDLLDYAQIIAGSLKINIMPFDIKKIVGECMKLIEIQLQGRAIILKKSYKNVPDIINSDPYRIKQIILNLLSNAQKFTIKGWICIEVIYKEGEIEVKCKDTGIGIPKEKYSMLFTQYGKIEDSFTLNPQGVGLGLMISNMLVKKIGGDGINVKSKINRGSCFSFNFKVEEGIRQSVEIPEEDVHVSLPILWVKAVQQKIEILIVDDTYFNILALMQLLKCEGISCSFALNGQEAIEKIKSNSYSCILMDCEMPILDGWETSKILKELYLKKEIPYLPPIIASTAYTSEQIMAKCLECGMCDVLIKPCEKSIVLNKIGYWISNSNIN
ncbi:hypothetical protein SteCoe_12023 [Stentor coeruleus]|uniref:Histidine kinase n=1 Tax=Stentor coeruleus TaxID=5963 RepID=A0A1R2CBR9_9CILI|nr:hypothetical protein SteCoe_12023 [Stentor coeruleus]